MPTVYADDLLTAETSHECAVPGYLVVRLRAADATLATLDPASAERVGAILARTARAIMSAVGAERVYVLSFCELVPQLHFHLFPRTRWLLDAFLEASGAAGRPLSGATLFEWARTAFPAGSPLPASAPRADDLPRRLRQLLAAR